MNSFRNRRAGRHALVAVVLSAVVCATFFASAAAGKTGSNVKSIDYAARAQQIVGELVARKFDKIFAQFTPALAARLSEKKLAQTWTQLVPGQRASGNLAVSSIARRSGYQVVTLTCSFEPVSGARPPFNVVLAFGRDGRLANLHFALATEAQVKSIVGLVWKVPPYALPTKFHEVSVTISDGQWRLPGILALPDGKGPFPAVVLLSGAGPHDADETTGFNKPLKDLAWGLATQGIAVLRYPKRTYVYGAKSSANPENFTVRDEYIDDARAAVSLLAGRPEINPTKIFLAGLGEGGYIAPRIAAGDPQIAGIIILNGNTRPIEQVIARVFEDALKRQGQRFCTQTYPSIPNFYRAGQT